MTLILKFTGDWVEDRHAAELSVGVATARTKKGSRKRIRPLLPATKMRIIDSVRDRELHG